MKNATPTSTVTSLTNKDLASIFGGSDDVIDPETILGDSSLIVEDIYTI